MLNKKMLRYLKYLTIFFTLSLTIIFPNSVIAAGNAIVSVEAPVDDLEAGEQFSISVNVVPNNAIAGMQFSFSYNTSIVTVNSVAEGNLLNQGGASTFFNPGQINNTAGTITGVFGVIINPGQTVTTAGTFAIITMTAKDVSGSTSLTLSNVIIGDVESQPLPVTLINDTISVTGAAPVSPPPGGIDLGSGGGGGGGGVTSSATFLNEYMNDEGLILIDAAAVSEDGQVTVYLPEGTTAKNKYDQPLLAITIKEYTEPPELPNACKFVCLTYDIGPNGATFDPPTFLIFSYSDEQIPAGVSEENLVFAALQDGQWVELEGCVVNAAGNTVTAPISHLSVYTILAYTSPASFDVTDLTITPAEVSPNEIITINATITNNGDLTGSFEAILTIDNEIVLNQTKTLNGGSSETIIFDIVTDTVGEHRVKVGNMAATFVVKKPLAAAAFTIGELDINPVTANSGDKVHISFSITNTGDLSGTYPLTLYLDNEIIETREIDLDGGGSITLSFSFSTDTIGEHTINIGDLQGVFEVASSLLPPVPELPDLEIKSFSTAPEYDEITSVLVSAKIEYQMNQTWASEPDARLIMTVLYNGEPLERVPLLTMGHLMEDGKTGELNYIPSAGWMAGEYTFRMELYNGENILQDMLSHSLVVTPEAVAKVVSWWTLGAVMGIASIFIAVLLAITIYRRRDMLGIKVHRRRDMLRY